MFKKYSSNNIVMNMSYIIIYSLFFIIFQSHLATCTLCPAPEVIAPCHCHKYFNLIDCSTVSESTNLANIFKKLAAELKKTNTKPIYDQFKLVESKLVQIDNDDLFAGISFRKISIQRNNKLERLSANLFSSTFGVTSEIVIEDNVSLGSDDNDAAELFKLLNQFTNLRSLHVTDCGVKTVPDNAFGKKQNSLKELVLTDNRITRIGENAFAGLNNLELLNLDGNLIEKLSKTTFNIPSPESSKKHLLKLFLRSNRLQSNNESFPEEIFSHLRERRVYLNLALNNLTSIPRSTFQAFFLHGNVLSIQKNPLICDCDFEWLLEQGWLYNSSSPLSEFQLRDYQCTKPIIPSADNDFDDFYDDQPITEVTSADFRYCHTNEESNDINAQQSSKFDGRAFRKQLLEDCILPKLSVPKEYYCLNSSTNFRPIYSMIFAHLLLFTIYSLFF